MIAPIAPSEAELPVAAPDPISEQEEPSGGESTAAREPVRIGGRYEIDLAHPLGGGGMAVVYAGRDLRTRRDVAVKTLRREYQHDAETRARFRREARLMAFLAHDNVVRVFDFVEDRGTSWVVLELVAGRSLKDELLDRDHFSPEETGSILDQVAGALAHLHDRGLVHLDVKPQNLLIDRNGRVKLIDFGLAQQAGGHQEVINGRTFGTAAYLAPEQACGEPVEPATDVYALGCVVYELLTGRPPFDSGNPGDLKNDVIRAHLDRRPDAPSAVRPDLALPGWIDDVLLWALAKEPGARYANAPAFARLYRAGLDGEDLEPAASIDTTAPVSFADAPIRDGSYLPTDLMARPVTIRYAQSSADIAGPARRVAEGAYRLGGRAARHTGWLRRRLWRATAALAIGNALLALLLLVVHGQIPGLYDPASALATDGTATVAAADLLVFNIPSESGVAISMVDTGETVTITGSTVASNGEEWWPVAFTEGDLLVEGFVAADGIEGGVERTPWQRFRAALGLD